MIFFLVSLLVPIDGHSKPLSHDPTEWSLAELQNYRIPRLDVLGAHIHRKGELMIAYQYMFMSMKGNREGNVTLSTSNVYDLGFMVSPIRMDMQMHMLDVMYAPSDNLTFMAMAPYIRLSMDHQTSPMMGSALFTTKAEGIGDITLTTFVTISRQNNSRVILSPGISPSPESPAKRPVVTESSYDHRSIPPQSQYKPSHTQLGPMFSGRANLSG